MPADNGGVYETALDPQRREIRLLALKAGAHSADLCCSLSVKSLADEPCYDALSYAWGSIDGPGAIEVDGITVPVTRNLEIALRHLRSVTADRQLWIDAICINQLDVEERNAQVSLMGSIYRTAERVLVWLGEADATSDMAFDLMPKIDSRWVNSAEEASSVWSFYFDATRRPYMSRVWIIQEFALARRDPVVLCGHKQVSWSLFMSAYKALALDFFTTIDMVRQDYAEGRVPGVLAKLRYDLFDELRTTINQDGGADLRQLLIMSRPSETTEPRDRIYGLLEILDVEDRKHFEVDYSKPTAMIYAEAMSLIFRQGGGPHFVGGMWCCSVPNPAVPDLPSWVPDFSSQTAEKQAPSPLNIQFHPPFPRSASGPGADADNGRVLDDLKTLSVEALPVDVVEDVLHFGETLTECIAQLSEVSHRVTTASLRSISDENLRPFIERFRSSEPLWRTLISNKKYSSAYDAAPDSYEIIYLQLLASQTRSHNITDGDALLTSEYCYALETHLPRHAFFTTRNGLVGVGMPGVRAGDEVTIWFGANVPFLVRPCEHDTTKCALIGAAYVAGIMEGQMVDELYCEGLLDSKTLLVV